MNATDEKILALAWHPGTPEQEAVAAFLKLKKRISVTTFKQNMTEQPQYEDMRGYPGVLHLHNLVARKLPVYFSEMHKLADTFEPLQFHIKIVAASGPSTWYESYDADVFIRCKKPHHIHGLALLIDMKARHITAQYVGRHAQYRPKEKPWWNFWER